MSGIAGGADAGVPVAAGGEEGRGQAESVTQGTEGQPGWCCVSDALCLAWVGARWRKEGPSGKAFGQPTFSLRGQVRCKDWGWSGLRPMSLLPRNPVAKSHADSVVVRLGQWGRRRSQRLCLEAGRAAVTGCSATVERERLAGRAAG